MAEIHMSYIIIEVQKHESETLQQLLMSDIDGAINHRDDDFFYMTDKDDVKIEYSFNKKRMSNRCYLTIKSSLRINQGIEQLQKIDDAICKSQNQRYYTVIKSFDGISDALCEKLYKKFSTFEREMRQLILLVLTKAFGTAWRNETVPEDMLKSLKQNAHGNISLSDTLEQMDLATLEQFLFEKRECDYKALVEETLSEDQLSSMTKEDICQLIDEARARSLWKRNFEFIGSEEKWSEKIHEIHEYRNKVAHCKKINHEEYAWVNKKLNRLNSDILSAIDEMQDKDFTDVSAIDVLGSFAIIASKLANSTLANYDFTSAFEGLRTALQRLTEPITRTYNESTMEALQRAASVMSSAALFGESQQRIIDNMQMASKAMADAIRPIGRINISAAELSAISVAQSFNNLYPNINRLGYASEDDE